MKNILRKQDEVDYLLQILNNVKPEDRHFIVELVEKLAIHLNKK